MTPLPSVKAMVLRGGLAVLVAAVSACGGEEAETSAQTPPIPVRTTEVSVTRQATPVRGSGIVASRAEMNLAFKIPGYVAEVLVNEGERVAAGQVLARLRSDEVDAGVRAAEAQAQLASRSLARLERLLADSVVTQATMDEAQDGFERAQAALEVARFNQTYATIRAPGPGRVLRRMTEVSEFVGAGMPVIRLSASNSAWVVRMGVPDRYVASVSVGDPAEVSLSAQPGKAISGRVSEIAGAADPRTGTFEVEVTVDGDVAGLRSGMVARVVIRPSGADELSYIPPQALIDTEGLDGAVFVVEGGAVRRQAVRVVRIGAESVGVRAPELEGATIVTDGAAYLRDGDRVEDRTADLPARAN